MSLDDRLRELFHRSIDTAEVADPEVLAEELVRRLVAAGSGDGGGGGAGGGVIGRALFWSAGLTLVAGIGLGLTLALTGDDPVEASGSILSLDGVPIYACPGETRVGSLHRGDEVLIVGRSAEGDWLAVRNVRGRGETVYIEAASVLADDDIVALPEKTCDDAAVVAIGATTVPSTVTTTSPEGSTTIGGGGSTTSTETTVTTGTTVAPDTTAPSLGQPMAKPDTIWEQDSEVITCPVGTPRQAVIEVSVTDDVGVSSVSATWTIGGINEEVNMTNTTGNTWAVTFGSYPADTVPGIEPPYETPVTVTIEARDGSGNMSTRSLQVIVTSVNQCFG